MLIPHGALVLVLDDDHVRLLRNRGRDHQPDFELVPARLLTRALGDGPADPRRRLTEVLDTIAPLLAAGTPLLLVAPSRTLGGLRDALPKAYRGHVVAEIAKDLTRCPPAELAERLHMAHA
ncbi:host attachment protein [Sphingomonas cannabina]|uniref:baeRF12 domain-containing protein n=1 Tax=Sphingomonas cannabina TaxID=2899123 RepID=UPI001F43D509|nr:host attachment protein [Sphingomonas cannabina]UIJ46333.1 host attachment protein [Sphingomonas cannabina]